MRMYQFIGPVLLVITVASAQAPTASEIYYTGGSPNGRFWSRRTQQEKIIWLFGYSDGIKTAAAFVYRAEPTNKLLQQFVLDLQPTEKLTTTEIAVLVPFHETAPVPKLLKESTTFIKILLKMRLYRLRERCATWKPRPKALSNQS